MAIVKRKKICNKCQCCHEIEYEQLDVYENPEKLKDNQNPNAFSLLTTNCCKDCG